MKHRSLEEAMDFVKIYVPRNVEVEKPRVTIRGGPAVPKDPADNKNPVKTPVNRMAARVTAPAQWWAKPPETYDKVEKPCEKELSETTKPKKPKHRKTKKMKNTPSIPGQPFVADSGLTIQRDEKGEPLMKWDEVQMLICAEVSRLTKEVSPAIKAARDARDVIEELTKGIGGEMEKFKIDAKNYLQDIRATRMSMVSEVSAMTGPLREVRQFFHGADYDVEIKRLREFVDLCERLNALKESGFLDTMADTMIRLAR